MRNDTWDGITGVYASPGTAFALPLALVRMSFGAPDGSEALALTSDDAAQIIINDDASWDFTVLPRILDLTAGIYSYGVETTDTAGTVKTRLVGTIEILADPVP